MDGTLINTEDLYTEASSELLAQYDKGPLTWDFKIKLQGLPGPKANELMVQNYELPITPEEFTEKVLVIQSKIWHKAQFLPGAQELITHLKNNNVPISLGTSSNKINFERKTQHLPLILDVFGNHIVTGDDTRIPRGKGKPNPHIWYTCLGEINKEREAKGLECIKLEECLVFEDGIPGVLSGLAADCHVIWIPHPDAGPYIGEIKTQLAEKKLDILEELTQFDVSRISIDN